jgi:putative glutamine amidotransferase
MHAVEIDPDSRLAHVLGTTRAQVRSWHHQGIDRLGEGLRAVAWAEDGVVEAVEHLEHPWCIACSGIRKCSSTTRFSSGFFAR